MRKTLLLTTLIFAGVVTADTALSFGGLFGGGHGSKSRSGVDSIGVHVDGKTKDLEPACPEHSEKVGGLCQCVEGYVSDLQGGCVANQCVDFEATTCATECNPITGELTYATEGTACGTGKVCDGEGSCGCISGYLDEGAGCYANACAHFQSSDCITACHSEGGVATYTYANLCNNGQHHCNANHECVDPCDEAEYTECQTCVAHNGDAQISNKSNTTTCGTNGAYVCQDGACSDPCTGNEETSDCLSSWSAQNGTCQPNYVANGSKVNHKVCDGQGGFTCEEGYQNESGNCVQNACYGFEETACTTGCSSSNGVATYTYANLCNNGQWVCNENHECVHPCGESENTVCFTYAAVDGQCQKTIHENTPCDPNDEYRICGADGECLSCSEGYTYHSYYFNSCTESCVGDHQYLDYDAKCHCHEGYVMNDNKECVKDYCYGIYDAELSYGHPRTPACVQSCDPFTGAIVGNEGVECATGRVCDSDGYCACPEGYVMDYELSSCVENKCLALVAENPCIDINYCDPRTGNLMTDYGGGYLESGASCGTNKMCNEKHECVCAQGFMGEDCTDCAYGMMAVTNPYTQKDECLPCPEIENIQLESDCMTCYGPAVFKEGQCWSMCSTVDTDGTCCESIEEKEGVGHVCCNGYRTNTDETGNNQWQCCPTGSSPNLDGICIECGEGNHYNLAFADAVWDAREGTVACGKRCLTNDQCPSDKFCYLDTLYTGAFPDTEQRVGSCVSPEDMRGMVITAVTVEDQPAGTWIASRVGMNWWSARNFCARYGNVDLPTRTQICGSEVSLGDPCSSMLRSSITNSGVTSMISDTFWLEDTGSGSAYVADSNWNGNVIRTPNESTGKARPNGVLCGPINPETGSSCGKGMHWDANNDCVCDNNATAYCLMKYHGPNDVELCEQPLCCAGEVAYGAGYSGADQCCGVSEHAYCAKKSYESDKCEQMACCSGEVSKGTGLNGADECLLSYCTTYNNQNECASQGTCSGIVYVPDWNDELQQENTDKHEMCRTCPYGGVPYCEGMTADDANVCESASCCDGTLYRGMKWDGGDVCCTNEGWNEGQNHFECAYWDKATGGCNWGVCKSYNDYSGTPYCSSRMNGRCTGISYCSYGNIVYHSGENEGDECEPYNW